MADASGTLPAMMQAAWARHGPDPCCYSKHGGKWVALTYEQLAEAVELLARGLASRGIRHGDRVAVLLDNSPEWVIADAAILHLGAITVPLHTALPARQNEACLRDAAATALLTSGDHWRPLSASRANLPDLAHVVTADGAEDTSPWSALTSDGRTHREENREAFARTWQGVTPEDVASIVYTSGTTGEPKGVVLTHGNLVANVTATGSLLDLDETAVSLSLLPLSHGFERIAEYVGMQAGGRVFYSESVDAATVRENLKTVRPTILIGVPRLYEKAYARVMDELRTRSPRATRAFTAGLTACEWSAEGERRGEPATALARMLRPVVFRKVHAALGGRIRMLISGGAPLSEDVARFFWAVGIPIHEGYGLTETSPVITLNRPGATRLGTVGQAIPGVEVAIDDGNDVGEILTRGPHVMQGYWRNPTATADVLTAEGWLRTGDLGSLDKSGHLRISGRKKEIIVKSNGKNVAPAPIEKRLESSPGILQAVCVGDAKPFIGALIVPDVEELGRALDRPFTLETAHADPEVLAAVERAVERVNADLAGFERVKEFRILRRELTIDDGTLTPTLKVKRRVVGERFAAEVASIYRGIDDAHAPSSSRDS